MLFLVKIKKISRLILIWSGYDKTMEREPCLAYNDSCLKIEADLIKYSFPCTCSYFMENCELQISKLTACKSDLLVASFLSHYGMWQSTWGKWWLTHWASLLRWIWSISEYNHKSDRKSCVLPTADRNMAGVLTSTSSCIFYHLKLNEVSGEELRFVCCFECV